MMSGDKVLSQAHVNQGKGLTAGITIKESLEAVGSLIH
jgi:hypothetical protein